MVFSSLVFLFGFLPVTLLLYYVCPRRLRNGLLLLVSFVFYAWEKPAYLGILCLSILANYVFGRWVAHSKAVDAPRKAKGALLVAVMFNLVLLGFFKYTNFVLTNVNQVFSSQWDLLSIAMPLGISFFTFQAMSYVIDVYRGEVAEQKNLLLFGVYVSLFPQLVAGPIVRYKDVAGQLNSRTETFDSFSYGIQRFCLGLFKKVMLANPLGLIWHQISTAPVDTLPLVTAWLGAIAFTFQIYFDFSGYSDMAIGLGRMFGFRFLENFRHPYLSQSITEFWRRWHISLGTWFKEYVYFPLGGSRRGGVALIRNLLLVWGLTGLWHGASWNFLVWGLYFGLLLMAEKFFLLQQLARVPAWVGHLYTLVLVTISWVIFAFEEISAVGHYLGAMFGLQGAPLANAETWYLLQTNGILLLFCVLASTNLGGKLHERFLGSRYAALLYWGESMGTLLLFLVSVCFLVGSTYNPFLYFRF